MHPGPQRPRISTSLPSLLPALLMLSLLAPHTGAQAQTETRSTQLYRCGPDGRDLRDSPCPEHAAKPAQSVQHDQPSAEQMREARERAVAQQRQADAMERERQAREAKAKPATPAGIRHRSEPAVGAASAPATMNAPHKNKAGKAAHKPSPAASTTKP